MRLHKIDTSFGGIVQLVEHRTHIPYVIGSSPIAPIYLLPTILYVVGIFFAAQSLPYFLQLKWILLRTKHHEEQRKKNKSGSASSDTFYRNS